MKTMEIVIPQFEGPVLVHHEPDWSGDAVLEWRDGAGHHRVSIPAVIVDKVGQTIRKSHNTRSRHARTRFKFK